MEINFEDLDPELVKNVLKDFIQENVNEIFPSAEVLERDWNFQNPLTGQSLHVDYILEFDDSIGLLQACNYEVNNSDLSEKKRLKLYKKNCKNMSDLLHSAKHQYFSDKKTDKDVRLISLTPKVHSSFSNSDLENICLPDSLLPKFLSELVGKI